MGATARPAPVRYRLSVLDPNAHLLAVEMHVPPGHPDPLRLAMPAWTPGSYKVRDFCRNVSDFAAVDGRGRRLPWRKIDKQTWEVDARGGTAVVVRYRVYANELGVRTSHLDDRHAHVNGASVFLYVPGLTGRPCEVHVARPRGWRAAAGLTALGPARFMAPDYDALVDGPIEMGEFDEAQFRERSVPHRLVVCGVGTARAVDLVPDVQRIVRASAALFGGLPYRDYTFFIHLAGRWGGGLEHASSSSLVVERDTFAPRDRYLSFLQLVAHEHFHAWNGKRLRPKGLGPFDYRGETYTRSLWVVEGWTSYYEKLLLRRAELASAQEVLDLFGEKIRKLRETPGRAVQSLAAASFDAWIKHYQPDENTPNSSISYYDKGQLVALLLDLRIRGRTQGRRSLDDVLRWLVERYGAAEDGYPDEAVREAAERAAGETLARFWRDAVEGTAELDFEGALSEVGLRLVPEGADGPPAAALGVVLEDRGDRVVLRSVLAGGAAARAGLQAGDEIVAWEGVRLDRKALDRRLEQARPGDRVEVAVFRQDLLRSIPVVLGRAGPKKLRVEKDPRAPRSARSLYRGWMGEPF